jgi:hypothetical protein
MEEAKVAREAVLNGALRLLLHGFFAAYCHSLRTRYGTITVDIFVPSHNYLPAMLESPPW